MNQSLCGRTIAGGIFTIFALLTSAQDSPHWLSEPVTLDVAIRHALDRDPALRRIETLDDEAAGQVEQAALRPNPVVGAEVENILGTGPLRGIDGFELTLSVSQVFETAGKRERRTQLAERERELVSWQGEIRRAEVEAEVRSAFMELLVAQQTLDLRRDQLRLAESSLAETEKLVEAARASEVERTRARLSIRQREFSLQSDERQVGAARERLAALWGLFTAPDFVVVGGLRLEAPPSLSDLLSRLPQSAPVAQFDVETAVREASLALEEANAKPDFEVVGGARYFNEQGGDAALLVGIQMPWPVYDRNQGNIRSARARLRAVENDREAMVRNLSRQLVSAYRQLLNAFEEHNALTNELRPAAEQTHVDTQSGYERGQYTLLAVLESQAALFEIREAQLGSIARYAAALAQIESLTRRSTMER